MRKRNKTIGTQINADFHDSIKTKRFFGVFQANLGLFKQKDFHDFLNNGETELLL